MTYGENPAKLAGGGIENRTLTYWVQASRAAHYAIPPWYPAEESNLAAQGVNLLYSPTYSPGIFGLAPPEGLEPSPNGFGSRCASHYTTVVYNSGRHAGN